MTQICVGQVLAYDDPSLAHGRSGDDQSVDRDATLLMDQFRRTGSEDVFGQLVRLTTGQLMRRVRRRVRFAGDHLDPHEMLQDAYVNIFRYPDRFDPSRPAAFRAWATTIVDNTVRRHLRRSRSGPDVALRSMEALSQEPDTHAVAPEEAMMKGESERALSHAFLLFLAVYQQAYAQLTEREQFALQMVEVRGLRYVELGKVLGIRAEAVKMVVFRARRRIFERMSRWIGVASA